MKTLSKFAGILFLMATLTLSAQAAENTGIIQQRVKTALNGMVQDVKAAETPAAKREVLNKFLGKVEHGSQVAERLPFLSPESRAALAMLEAKFGSYKAELQGGSQGGVVKAPVADQDLNAFASFVQQDVEQAAEATWGNGGIYLSAGAVIIILLIIILIT